MNTTPNRALERQELEELLPWHAAGTLSPRDAQRVEQALAKDKELARRFALVQDELAETIHLNETLGAPSTQALNRLMAGIERHSGPVRKTSRSLSLGARLYEFVETISPRKVAWAGTAAAAIIALQAGLLASMYVSDRADDGGFRSVELPSTRSFNRGGTAGGAGPAAPTLVGGSFALIGFAPQASAADITRFLESNELQVVDGPRAGGVYRVRVASTALTKPQVEEIIARLRQESGIVRMASPAE